MFNNHTHDDLFLMFSQYSEDQLTAKQAAELDELLQKSSEARFLYVKYRAIEAKMERWFGRCEQGTIGMPIGVIDDMENPDLRINPSEKTDLQLSNLPLPELCEEVFGEGPFKLDHGLDTKSIDVMVGSFGKGIFGGLHGSTIMWGGAIFTLLLVTMLFTFIHSSNSQGIGTVVQTVNAVWEGDVRESDLEEMLSVGSRLNLKSGLVQVRYENGVRVNLEGPVTYEVSGPNQGTLFLGKMSALVNHEANGFTVQTPVGQVIDLGTEFGINVAQNRNTQVQVFDGHVNLVLPENGKDEKQSKPVNLAKGDSVFVDPRQKLIKRVSYTPDLFSHDYKDIETYYYYDDFSVDTSNEYVGNCFILGTQEASHSVVKGKLFTQAKATTYSVRSMRRLLGIGEYFAVDVPPAKPGLNVFTFASTLVERPRDNEKGTGAFRIQRDAKKGLVIQRCDFKQITHRGEAFSTIIPYRVADPAPDRPLRLIIQRNQKNEFVFYYELDGVRTKIWGPTAHPYRVMDGRLYVGVGVSSKDTKTALFDNFVVRSVQD